MAALVEEEFCIRFWTVGDSNQDMIIAGALQWLAVLLHEPKTRLRLTIDWELLRCATAMEKWASAATLLHRDIR